MGVRGTGWRRQARTKMESGADKLKSRLTPPEGVLFYSSATCTGREAGGVIEIMDHGNQGAARKPRKKLRGR
jgi:hypothetical protein